MQLTLQSLLIYFDVLPNGQPVGTHALVICLLKGVFQSRPSLPRRTVTWDTDGVLAFCEKLSPVSQVSSQHPTLKSGILVTLLSGQRAQSLHLMDIRNITVSKSFYKLMFGDLLKTSKIGKHQNEITMIVFAPGRRLCVVTVLIKNT